MNRATTAAPAAATSIMGTQSSVAPAANPNYLVTCIEHDVASHLATVAKLLRAKEVLTESSGRGTNPKLSPNKPSRAAKPAKRTTSLSHAAAASAATPRPVLTDAHPRAPMSAAGRAKIAAAQRARWAKFKKQQRAAAAAGKNKTKVQAQTPARAHATTSARPTARRQGGMR